MEAVISAATAAARAAAARASFPSSFEVGESQRSRTMTFVRELFYLDWLPARGRRQLDLLCRVSDLDGQLLAACPERGLHLIEPGMVRQVE